MRFTHISSCGIDPQLLMYGPKKLILTLSDADLQAGPRMRFTRPRLGCEAPPRREGRGPGRVSSHRPGSGEEAAQPPPRATTVHKHKCAQAWTPMGVRLSRMAPPGLHGRSCGPR